MEQQENAYPALPQSFGILGMLFLFSLILAMPFWLLGKIHGFVDLNTPTINFLIGLCLYVCVLGFTYRYAKRKFAFYSGNEAKLLLRYVSVMELVFCFVLAIAMKLFIHLPN